MIRQMYPKQIWTQRMAAFMERCDPRVPFETNVAVMLRPFQQRQFSVIRSMLLTRSQFSSVPRSCLSFSLKNSRRTGILRNCFSTTTPDSFSGTEELVQATQTDSDPTEMDAGINRPMNSATTASSPTTVRISKFIAQQAGISRKEVERAIRLGAVTLFGKEITSPAALIPISDLLQPHNAAALVLKGQTVPITPRDHPASPSAVLQSQRVRVWLVHKMVGELVTDVDPYRRPTVMTRVAKLGKHRNQREEHIKAIGRLDMNTEGLLVVTNCGAYARDMEYAGNRVHRTYRVRVHGKWQPYKLHAIRNGTVVADGVRYPPMRVSMEETRKRSAATNQWIQITCAQGRNRQIRKVLKQLQLTVTRLIRISYGDYELTGIPKGMVKEVPVIPLAQHTRRGLIRRSPRRKENSRSVDPQAAPVQWVRMKK